MNSLLLALAMVGNVAADRLLVASYGNETHNGAIQTLEVLPSTSENAGSAIMTVAQENQECGKLPTWLDVSLGLDRIVCLDESAANASLTMLSLGQDGGLSKVSSSNVLGGAVSMATYSNKSALALAHVSTIPPFRFLSNHILTFNSTVLSQPSHCLPLTAQTPFHLSKTSPSRRRSRSTKPSLIPQDTT
jgi:hypothetical protein